MQHVGKPEEKRRTKCGWENNIKIDVEKIRHQGAD
jgi:hypothetical protein